MTLTVNEIASTMSVTEFVRMGSVVDEYCRNPWTCFDVLRLVRDANGVAVLVDAGRGRLFWVVVAKDSCYVQRGRLTGHNDELGVA